jgi:hypothetical protein
MVVGEVAGQDAAPVPLVQDQDVVETFAPDRANETFREGILPRTVGGGQHLPDPHAGDGLPEQLVVDGVGIAEEVRRRGVIGERLGDLLGRPAGGGMRGHVEVEDLPPLVGEHDEDEEEAPPRGRHGEKIDRDQVADVIGEKRAPGLRRRGAPLRHQPGDRAFPHGDAQLLGPR